MLRDGLRHRARRRRPADLPAVRAVRSGAGHDLDHSGHGSRRGRRRPIRASCMRRSSASASTSCSARPPCCGVLATHGAAAADPASRVISAGAPVPPDVVARMLELLPDDAQFWTPYGATECLPVAVIEGRELLRPRARTEQGAGTCVGRPVPPNEVRIIRDQRRRRSPTGPTSCALPRRAGRRDHRRRAQRHRRLLQPRRADDALAKIRERCPTAATRIVHRMGDLGYFDDEGRLWFCGRKSQRVVTAAGTLYTEQVEPVFNAHPRCGARALVGVGERGAQRRCCAWSCASRRGAGPSTRGSSTSCATSARASSHTGRIERVLLHPGLPGRHPPQRQDRPRDAGRMGGDACRLTLRLRITGSTICASMSRGNAWSATAARSWMSPASSFRLLHVLLGQGTRGSASTN